MSPLVHGYGKIAVFKGSVRNHEGTDLSFLIYEPCMSCSSE